MDSKTKATAIGESVAKLHFEKLGYFTYTNTTGKSDFDLVISKDTELFGVEVKTVSVPKTRADGSIYYQVQLKSVRPNRSGNTIKYFDNTLVDFVAIVDMTDYTILVLDASKITQRTEMRVDKKDFI